MKSNTRKLIYEYIIQHPKSSVEDLDQNFSIKKVMIHRHLKKLIDEGSIYKEGTPPKVYYYATGGISLDISRHKKLTILTLKHNGKELTKAEKYLKSGYLQSRGQTYLQQCITDTEETLDLIHQSGAKIKPNMLYNMFAKVYITNDEIVSERFEAYMSNNFADIESQDDSERFLRFFGVYSQ